MRKVATKRAVKKRAVKADIDQIIARDRRLRELISAIINLKARISQTEEDLKLPRSAYDRLLGDIEEHFNVLGDQTEESGIEACGGDIDAWVERVNGREKPALTPKTSLSEDDIARALVSAEVLVDISANYSCYGDNSAQAEDLLGTLISSLSK